MIPQGLQEGVAKAIEAFLLGISEISHRSINFEEIRDSVTSKLADLTGRERELAFLRAADEKARSCWNYHLGYAVVEGGSLGAGGLLALAADIPALFTIVIRLIQEIGTCYGYDVTREEEREYIPSHSWENEGERW